MRGVWEKRAAHILMLLFPDDLTLSQTPEQKTCSTANTLPHTCDLCRDNKNSLIASLKGEQEASRAPGEELKPKADYKDYHSVGFGAAWCFQYSRSPAAELMQWGVFLLGEQAVEGAGGVFWEQMAVWLYKIDGVPSLSLSLSTPAVCGSFIKKKNKKGTWQLKQPTQSRADDTSKKKKQAVMWGCAAELPSSAAWASQTGFSRLWTKLVIWVTCFFIQRLMCRLLLSEDNPHPHFFIFLFSSLVFLASSRHKATERPVGFSLYVVVLTHNRTDRWRQELRA